MEMLKFDFCEHLQPICISSLDMRIRVNLLSIEFKYHKVLKFQISLNRLPFKSKNKILPENTC